MKVLITGGLGFVGSHISNRFSERGYEVVILDNDGHTSCINRIDKAKYNYPTILIGDIQDSSIYDKLDTDFDLVINSAAETHVDESFIDQLLLSKPIYLVYIILVNIVLIMTSH